MTKFIPILTEPATTDKDFICVSKGGNNKCIEIKNGSVLPNCTGYVWGVWRKRLGKAHNLSVNQAEVWYTKNDGYERGQTPKLGAVICWSKGDPKNYKDGAGHVASVEQINADGSIVIGQSGSNTTKRFWTETIKPPYNKSGYSFQGFIYIPINYEEEQKNESVKPTVDILILVKETIRGDFGNGEARKKALGNNYAEVQRQVNLNFKHGTTNWDNIKLY